MEEETIRVLFEKFPYKITCPEAEFRMFGRPRTFFIDDKRGEPIHTFQFGDSLSAETMLRILAHHKGKEWLEKEIEKIG